ncbi:Nuclear cap-binding protein subunit 1 [Coniochaeta hoffmannii]|uniref:Nuclear cap-binding protein subunit 1 n=1 Tax=Coniochaeta hoffmannii TaxID=91930 RepID=A0AA38RBE6_9PEZI|nr:Nuclear cap-binding protein subunit 1 [Coniochaeta hoffmannii]
MADYDRRNDRRGGGGHYNNRKRRYRDDDDQDQRGPRRRFDAPPHVRVRKGLLAIAENPMRPWHEEVQSIANLMTENYDDELLRGNFVDLVLQLALEQPLKTPFTAAVVLVANTNKPELIDTLLTKLAGAIEARIAQGEWRDVKLYLKLLACLQSMLEGDGVFPVLEELFSRAVDLQTASSDDTIGTELVKIILLTIPYVMAAVSGNAAQKAADLMDKTDIIASEPHALQTLIDPYHPDVDEESPTASMSLIGLLQKQLQQEASNGWELKCLPRPWKFPLEDIEQQTKLDECPKHALPTIKVPETVVAGPRPLFPEVYFSVYAGQEVESVPPTTDIAASLVRDALLDGINVLDFNRHAVARNLIELDCYFAPKTFAARATPFDRLRDIEPGKSTWKPEDVAVDAVFSQLFQLPSPEHKLVYYHSVLTEACKQAPAAIAPSLGRAIRFLYRNQPRMDLELVNRFMDWFAHHLSNFGFTWKWTEWVDDVALPDLDPSKAFIKGAIDKEIRLSFAQRIKNTLPEPYQSLISADTEKDVPDFKFATDDVPFAKEGRELASMLRKKVAEEDIQPIIDRIQSEALDRNLDPLVTSTDVFVTAVLHMGSKTLSHVLAAIERNKDRLLDIGAASDAAREQILDSVASYWAAHPGVAVTIVEKLLNYSILHPLTVVRWALSTSAGRTTGESLARGYVYEVVFNTVVKVTSRVRQLVSAPSPAAKTDGDTAMGNAVDTSGEAEVRAMRDLFRGIEDALVAWAEGSKDEMIEAELGEGDGKSERDRLVRRWGTRWLRVFRRRAAIEEGFVQEAERKRALAPPEAVEAPGKGETEGDEKNGEGDGLDGIE